MQDENVKQEKCTIINCLRAHQNIVSAKLCGSNKSDKWREILYFN